MQTLPLGAQEALGQALARVQHGFLPVDWKPMPSVGAGVIELRVRVGGAFRLLYVARFQEAIYVLDVFEKKSPKTPLLHIQLAKARYRVVCRSRLEK